MNIATYLFGKFSFGYNQYPDDYTKSIFTTFKNNSKAKTQIAMHRDNDLMYYGYIRNLEGDHYIGLCVIINGYYISRITFLFSVFEKVIEMMVRNGYLIHFNDQGEIVTSTSRLVEDKEALSEVSQSLENLFLHLEVTKLPPVNYETSSLSVKNYSIQDDENNIVASSYSEGYTFLYKSRGYDTAATLGYKGVIAKLNKQISSLQEKQEQLNNDNKELKGDLTKMKLRQRNTKLVSILAVVIVILGIVIWNNVLFPDEVTKYDAGDFLYYGPIENGKPNGTGVAIYPSDDKDGRLYYYGNFTLGNRVDQNAIMFYRDGSYFRGSMDNDQWNKGVFYDVNGDYFEGTFKENTPFEGKWYKHVFVQKLNGNE